MDFTSASYRWSSPPLALQIVALLVGGLVVAQLVTLVLTLLLPPAPRQRYELDDIARALHGGDAANARGLQRTLQADSPQPLGPGWLTSERSRHELAVLLQRNDSAVQLWFYTPLPFAGTARGESRNDALREEFSARPAIAWSAGEVVRVDYLVAQAGPSRGLSSGDRGGGLEVGDRAARNASSAEGGRSANGAFAFPTSPTRDRTTGAFPRGDVGSGGQPRAELRLPEPTATERFDAAPRDSILVPQPASPAVGGTRGAAPTTGSPGSPAASQPGVASSRFVAPGVASGAPRLIMPMRNNGGVLQLPDVSSTAPEPRTTPGSKAASPQTAAPARSDGTRPASGKTLESLPPPVPGRVATPSQTVRPAPATAARAVASATPAATPRGLFGLAPAPFVEGDFIAALATPDGWVVVQPMPEPFPNSWQRRVLLWFALAFAMIAPAGWLFARRLVRPIYGFAVAAEQLGRDPTAPVMAIEGPAEVGRAAHAFNRMQSRLRSFVDDRTAMIGAISHDLRTPLTRLRFRIEEVDELLRDGMLHEVDEMEKMITSVLNFIRDASDPGSREKLDLSTIVEDIVEDAVFVGNDVRLTLNERAPVEVDAIGMRRLLSNLVENAVKYGDHARVRLFTDRTEAVTEVSDDGPGLPDDELERVFEPFYRAEAAKASDKRGSGLGLAVCRSIARAHGGDVSLMRGERGLIAQVRLPLAYGARG